MTRYRLLKYTSMPLGPNNDPDTCERAMGVILVSLKWKHALVCIDDIIFAVNTSKKHLKHIGEVLILLMKAVLKMKIKYRHLYCRSFDFLGHVTALGKLQVTRETTETVAAVQDPMNLSKVWSFLKLCHVHRRLVLSSALLAVPLSKKSKNGNSFASS